ncbi:hypothetical protein RIF29_17193 [Crotalaria pallida]|uniref:Exocyst subunit Exo70 family protein n=1 Tax=Crotalaria pallida TaxID=3830 RepID=A0AAN9FK31_CROPI
MMPVSTQLQRWLMQPEKLRFVGFISAVFGLLCYAFSSSFNHLFGNWNFLKLFLYSIFSFIIVFITLFARVWQFSTSTLFKTRMAVLVLIATTAYSYFYDKAVNQKPDAYILVSCVAFAVMSLSLSKQTRCGCEADLVNFFLGCLMILLIKLSLWLFFVGAGFSYSLTIFRSSIDATPQSGFSEDFIVIQVDSQHDNIDSVIPADSQSVNTDSAVVQVSQHVNTDSATQMDSLKVDGALMMKQLKACISELKKGDRISLRQLYAHLDKQFNVLDGIYDADDNLVIDSLLPETINNLQEIVKLMVAAGFEKECCSEYISCRRKFLQKCFLKFHLSKFNLLEFNSQESINLAIDKWIIASRVALRILFPCERRVCDRVFFGFSSAADLSFVEVCREITIDLLNFANKIATEIHSLGYLGSSLKVFQNLTDLIPEFESLFYGDHSASLMNEASVIGKRLGEAIRVIFMDLENDICRDMVQNSVPGGKIDPIISLVGNFFSVVSEFRNTLEQIFGGRNTVDQISKEYHMAVVGDSEGTFPSLSIRMARILALLDSNLKAKSKNYMSPASGYVFMINNCYYIVHMLRFSNLETIMGDDLIRKHTAKFQQNLEQTWDKVLDILKPNSNDSEESMKEKIKFFNMQFNEILKVQFVWDERLRQKMRISIENNLLPAYGNFIGRLQNLIGKHAFEYIEYSMFDIDALLNKLSRGSEEVLHLTTDM